jgi:hypothetical protein
VQAREYNNGLMYLFNWVVDGITDGDLKWWQAYSWPVDVSGNIGAMVCLSQVNNHHEDDGAAVSYIVGSRTGANPDIAYTDGDPSVIFVNDCTQLIFGIKVFGAITARISAVIWP